MSDFKAKMHQVRFTLGLCPRPLWGANIALPRLAVFKGPTSKGREGKREGRGRKGKGGEGERRWRERFGPPKNFGVAPPWPRAPQSLNPALCHI